jgi:flagellar biosynthesis/type III secretory pathway chaperone
MESGTATFQTPQHAGALPGPTCSSHSECLASARALLEVLREEAQILRRFAGAELLALVPKKEYLVSELEWKLKSAREAGADSLAGSDSLRDLFSEIGQLNASNGVFIKKSLSYWHDLLSVLLPPSYGPSGNVAAERPQSPPKGRSFRRKV